MKLAKIVLTGTLFATLALFSRQVQAQPTLQLDIVGGTYDTVNEDIVINADTFQLAAILNPTARRGPAKDSTFYIAVSLAPPRTIPDSGLGSFEFNGTTVNVTSDMTSGTPSGLPPHGHFPNFYKEFSFTFDLSSAGKVILYNTADDPGGPTFDTSGTAFAKLFDIDKSGLADGVELHFDLYHKNSKGKIDKFAPFSHDASSVPEPTGFVLTLAGVGLFAMIRRKHS